MPFLERGIARHSQIPLDIRNVKVFWLQENFRNGNRRFFAIDMLSELRNMDRNSDVVKCEDVISVNSNVELKRAIHQWSETEHTFVHDQTRRMAIPSPNFRYH